MGSFNADLRRQIDLARDLTEYHILYEAKERDGVRFIMGHHTIKIPKDMPKDETYCDAMYNYLASSVDDQMIYYKEKINGDPDEVVYYEDDKIIVRYGDIVRVWPILEEVCIEKSPVLTQSDIA